MDIPKYREGYPRLDIFNARKAINRGAVVCRFYKPLNVNAVGEAFILNWSGGEIFIAYCFLGPPERQGCGVARIETALADAPNASGEVREYFVCPGCEARSAILVFKYKWACATCHQLSHRSKLIPPGVRQQERVQELRSLVAGGRRKGMRQSTFRTYQRKLKELETQRGRKFGVACTGHQLVITARWKTIDEVIYDHGLVHPQYEIVGGEIVSRRPDDGGPPLTSS